MYVFCCKVFIQKVYFQLNHVLFLFSMVFIILKNLWSSFTFHSHLYLEEEHLYLEVALRVTSEPFIPFICLLFCVLLHGVYNLWLADTKYRFLGPEWVDNNDFLLVSGLFVIIVIVVGDPELLVPVHVADDSHRDQEGCYYSLGQHAEGDLHPGLSIYMY